MSGRRCRPGAEAVLVEDEAEARALATELQGLGLVESCLVARGSAAGASVLEES